MALQKRGLYWYGDDQDDIRGEIARFSRCNEAVAQHFADAVCRCGSKIFRLRLDDDAGAAVRRCVECSFDHPIGDSVAFLDEAELGECSCVCGGETFEITVGVALYDDSQGVKWLYLGCRCPACGLVGVYGDWKNEFEGYEGLLGRV